MTRATSKPTPKAFAMMEAMKQTPSPADDALHCRAYTGQAWRGHS